MPIHSLRSGNHCKHLYYRHSFKHAQNTYTITYDSLKSPHEHERLATGNANALLRANNATSDEVRQRTTSSRPAEGMTDGHGPGRRQCLTAEK